MGALPACCFRQCVCRAEPCCPAECLGGERERSRAAPRPKRFSPSSTATADRPVNARPLASGAPRSACDGPPTMTPNTSGNGRSTPRDSALLEADAGLDVIRLYLWIATQPDSWVFHLARAASSPLGDFYALPRRVAASPCWRHGVRVHPVVRR